MPLKQLPKLPVPAWLRSVSRRTMDGAPFPLREILTDSLYYPASGTDGDPIRYLGGNVLSFIYVDYGVTRRRVRARIRRPGLRGYRLVGMREVRERELTPNGWTPLPLEPRDGDPARMDWFIKPPFCEWYVFERTEEYDEAHGPERLSLLYLGADGAAAYQALYMPNGIVPRVIAIIQPGRGFGGNWTDFEDPTQILGRSVLQHNPAGIPKILLYGGIGQRRFYEEPCWPQYDRWLGWLRNDGYKFVGAWAADDHAPRHHEDGDDYERYLWRF